MAHTTDLQQQIDTLKKQLAVNEKIRLALMDRVERSIDSSGTAYSLFESNILLQEQVRFHTEKLERVNEELRVAIQAEQAASRAKSEFLARMSHEIRTPMNAIIGLAVLCRKTELTGVQESYLVRILESSRHLLGIINDILDFSKIEANKFKLIPAPFLLTHVLDRVAAMFAEKAMEKGIEMFYIINPDVPLSLNGDSLRLGQILINLVGNAVKFTNQGEIIIKAALDTDGPREDAAPDRAHLRFAVQDSGIGIAPDKIENLFDPFTQLDGTLTRKYEGTGLGLTISHRLATMMGGRIWVESTQEKGSTFYFTVSMERQPEEMRRALAAPKDLTGLKVLVVDDNETAQLIFKEMLRELSFDVTVVDSAKGAFDCLQAASSGRPYQLVLMDWRMPGLDGFEAARRIRSDPAITGDGVQPKIILVSMYGRDDYFHRASEEDACIDNFIKKPVSSSELFNAVMAVFGREDAVVPPLNMEKDGAGCEVAEEIKGARLLLVEDNPINQDVAIALLKGAGFVVEVADNGREAVDKLFALGQGAADYYDAVLMDIQMPVLDGYEATQILRRDRRMQTLPIIAMTAHVLEGDREKCLKAGMNDYVSKPIDEAQLYAVLQRWIKPGPRAVPMTKPPAVEDAAVSMPANLPGINVAAGLKRVKGDRRLYRRMLKKFQQQLENTGSVLKEHLQGGDTDAALKMVHTLKGVAGNIGADDLYTAALDLYARLKEEQQEPILESFGRFGEQLQVVLDAIRGLAPEATPAAGGAGKASTPVQPGPILRELQGLLKSRSTDALNSFERLKQALSDPQFETRLNRLEELVYGFDTAGALTVLSLLSEEIGLSADGEER